VETAGVEQILDAGEPLRPPNLPRFETLNSEGIVLFKKEKPVWKPIPRAIDVVNQSINAKISTTDNLVGTYDFSANNYSGFEARAGFFDKKNGQEWQKKLGVIFPQITLDSFATTDENQLEKPFGEKFKFTAPLNMSGDLIYLSPILYSNFAENPFKSAFRQFPVDFGHPNRNQTLFKIELPNGYKVESKPENLAISLPNNGGKFQFQVTVEANNITITSRLNILKPVFTAEEYPALRVFFDLMEQKLAEQIVLKKG
jgi:hypothetical protein